MREAVAKQANPLNTSLKAFERSMEIVLRLKGKQVQVKQIRFEQITKDVSTFYRFVVEGLQGR